RGPVFEQRLKAGGEMGIGWHGEYAYLAAKPRSYGFRTAGAVSRPLARSQFNRSGVHWLKDGSPNAMPTPWGPFSKMCISAGTLALRKARKKRTLFSTGTAGSLAVWNRNVGGVCGVTRRSLDRSSMSWGSGLAPSRLRTEPACVMAGSNEITG